MAYKRVVLKISGEALSNGKENIDFSIVKKVAGQVAELVHMGIEVCVIIGGGNIWRGRQGKDMNRVTACLLYTSNVTLAQLCTYSDSKMFYSHRRDGERAGAMGSFISLCE